MSTNDLCKFSLLGEEKSIQKSKVLVYESCSDPSFLQPLSFVFVANRVYNPTGDSKKWMEETVLVNPRIVEYSNAEDKEIEGCLSFPDMQGEVVRSKWIKVEAITPKGRKIKKKFKGWEARIFQHEYDHLQGTVYTDRLSEETKEEVKQRMDELVNEYDGDDAAL